MPLTDLEIRKAKTKEKAYRISDSGSLFPLGHSGRWKTVAMGA